MELIKEVKTKIAEALEGTEYEIEEEEKYFEYLDKDLCDALVCRKGQSVVRILISRD